MLQYQARYLQGASKLLLGLVLDARQYWAILKGTSFCSSLKMVMIFQTWMALIAKLQVGKSKVKSKQDSILG